MRVLLWPSRPHLSSGQLNRVASQICQAGLPVMFSRQGCQADLHRQGCQAELPGRVAWQVCQAELPGRVARQGFQAALPDIYIFVKSKENLPKTCFLRAGNTSKSIFPWCDTPVSESPLSLRPQKVNIPGVWYPGEIDLPVYDSLYSESISLFCMIPRGVSLFEFNIEITQQNLNQIRKYFNPAVSCPMPRYVRMMKTPNEENLTGLSL